MRKSTSLFIALFLGLCFFINSNIKSQQAISWLSDYTSDIITSSYSYNYTFESIDNNDCKIKITELKTDKKSVTTTKSYIFYLSDLDPSKITYKASGSIIIVTLNTKASQKFVSVMSDNVLEEYASSVIINMDAVDKARSFIEAIKSHSDDCKMTETKWTSTSDAFLWLTKNIVETSNGTNTKQSFNPGDKNYLAEFIKETSDSKGIAKKAKYIFNLSDINPNGVLLEISGKTIKVVVPIRDNKNYIQETINEQNPTYTKEIEIFSDDIEKARIIINAFNYLASNIKVQRKEWNSYNEALGFVKNLIQQTQTAGAAISYEFVYTPTTDGIVTIQESSKDSKGALKEETSLMYLVDMNPAVELEASSKNISIILNTKDKAKYIKQTSSSKTTGYTSDYKLIVSDLETARELITALDYSIKMATEGVLEFSTIEMAMDWIGKNPGDVYIDTKSYHQTIQFDKANENKADLNVIVSDASGASINERFEIYPEDISVENLKIKVIGKKMYVALSTGKNKYIKAFKGDAQQSYADEAEYLFEDINTAKNFVAAFSLISKKSLVTDRSMANKEAAYSFLKENVRNITIDGKSVEQKIEKIESNDCKLAYIMLETDSKGVSTENRFEIILSDIDLAKSTISISSKNLKINLVTKDKQKLVKTLKNGEPGNFISDVEFYTDDILLAKKLLASVKTLAQSCK